MLNQVGTQTDQRLLQRCLVAQVEQHAADFGLVRDLGRADFQHHRIVKWQLLRRLAVYGNAQARRMRQTQLVEQLISLHFVQVAGRGAAADGGYWRQC